MLSWKRSGASAPVGQVRRATLAPFLYPLLFYQKSGQKSIILCVANLTNGRKNRRNTACEIVQYDEPHSARPGTLRQQESSPGRAPEAAPARRSREQSGSKAPQAVQLSREREQQEQQRRRRAERSRQGQQQRQNGERRAPRPADHRQPQSGEAGAIQPQGAADDPGSIRKRYQAAREGETVQREERGESEELSRHRCKFAAKVIKAEHGQPTGSRPAPERSRTRSSSTRQSRPPCSCCSSTFGENAEPAAPATPEDQRRTAAPPSPSHQTGGASTFARTTPIKNRLSVPLTSHLFFKNPTNPQPASLVTALQPIVGVFLQLTCDCQGIFLIFLHF